jgi:hypothetical protein
MRRLFGCVGIVGFLVLGSAMRADAQFSLAAVDNSDCSSSFVNIVTTEAGGTLGFDFDITFDSAVIDVVPQPDGLVLGALTADCDFAYNDNLTDEVRISIACTTPKSGPGTIATIEFLPVANGSTNLNFENCALDENPCPGTSGDGIALSGCPMIDLSNGGNGAFGRSPGRACLAATLDAGAWDVNSTQTDIAFDPNSLAIEDCSVNPAIGKTLSRTVLGPGLQRIALSSAAPSAIPSTHLFVCRFTIASAVSGPFSLGNTSSVTDTGGVALATVGQDGSIGVTSCVGDCNGSGRVLIDEVVASLNAFGGNYLCRASDPTMSCPAADSDNSNKVEINEVVQSLNQFGAGNCPQ